jgi:hypothetical protein
MSETSIADSAAGGSVNLFTSLSNVAKLAAHPKFVWVSNANCDETIIYNEPVFVFRLIRSTTQIVMRQFGCVLANKK